VREGYGAKDRVFAAGGSAGGLLMGAVANEAPDRFRGIALHVPFVDVVTTMLDESIPLTTNEWAQWGDPREKPYYDAMLAYSPYDNLAARDYPAMPVTTGLWDPMVQYYEPAKTLRDCARARPIAIRCSTSRWRPATAASRDASSGSPKWRASTLFPRPRWHSRVGPPGLPRTQLLVNFIRSTTRHRCRCAPAQAPAPAGRTAGAAR
jgi:acetyl esterase/lipase